MNVSRSENLQHIFRDRELDPWTQTRFEAIQNRVEKCKNDFASLAALITQQTDHELSNSSLDEDT